MKRTIQFRVFHGEEQYVGECLDFAIVTQARTLDELSKNILEALALHLSDEDLEACGYAPNPTVILTMELEAVA